jgi:hypothetical protein
MRVPVPSKMKPSAGLSEMIHDATEKTLAILASNQILAGTLRVGHQACHIAMLGTDSGNMFD